MNATLAQQTKEVKDWLPLVFGDGNVSEFEVNQKTVAYLYNLMKESKQRDRNLELVTKDLQQKTTEYSAEAKRLSGVLNRVGTIPESLSSTGQSNLSTLTKLGLSLEVRDPSLSCCYQGLQELDDDIEEVEEQLETETNELNKLSSSHRSILEQYNSLKKVLDSCQKDASEDKKVNAKRQHETTFYEKKIGNYEKDIGKFKVQLHRAKFDPSLSHENMVKKSEALKAIAKEVEPLKAELESYSVLPPDLAEAKIKVEEYKQKLAKLDEKLSECIGNTMAT